MAIRMEAIEDLTRLLGAEEAQSVYRLALRQDKLERSGTAAMDKALRKITERVLKELEERGRITESTVLQDIQDALVEHAFQVMEAGLSTTPKVYRAEIARLAAPPKGRLPRTLKALFELWGQYRNRKYIPKRERALAERIKKKYLAKVQSVWERHSEDFREGEAVDREEIADKIRKESGNSYAYAHTVVQTETTRYYNASRKAVYDTSPDVSHYLAVAVRDMRTTDWCKPYHQHGRDGLVYEKDDPELPSPFHWNCRTEILPLTYSNPAHRALINDKGRARRRNTPKPLPPGWNSR